MRKTIVRWLTGLLVAALTGCGPVATAPDAATAPAAAPGAAPASPPAADATAAAPATAASSVTAAPSTAPAPAAQAPAVQSVRQVAALGQMKAQILDSTTAWPRRVLDATGVTVTIPAPSRRIHTLSLGYDEITAALVGPEALAAVGTYTKRPDYSNIAAQVQHVPGIKRDAEAIISHAPDLVVASPYSKRDLVDQLRAAGIPVVVSDLLDSIDGQETNIRFLAYLYGAEDAADALLAEVNRRLAVIDGAVAALPVAERPRVLRLDSGANLITAGANTTMDGIIRRAGGVNVAAEAGLERWPAISLEKVVELAPDVIVVGTGDKDQDLRAEILGHPALQAVPAIKNGRVYGIPQRYTGTLSHWNVRGVEELAAQLWPERFADVDFKDYER